MIKQDSYIHSWKRFRRFHMEVQFLISTLYENKQRYVGQRTPGGVSVCACAWGIVCACVRSLRWWLLINLCLDTRWYVTSGVFSDTNPTAGF